MTFRSYSYRPASALSPILLQPIPTIGLLEQDRCQKGGEDAHQHERGEHGGADEALLVSDAGDDELHDAAAVQNTAQADGLAVGHADDAPAQPAGEQFGEDGHHNDDGGKAELAEGFGVELQAEIGEEDRRQKAIGDGAECAAQVFVARGEEVAFVEKQRAKEGTDHKVEAERFADGAEDQHEDDHDAEERFGTEDADEGFGHGVNADVAFIEPGEQPVHGQHDEGERAEFERCQADRPGGIREIEALRDVEDDAENEQRRHVVNNRGGERVFGHFGVQDAQAFEQFDGHGQGGDRDAQAEEDHAHHVLMVGGGDGRPANEWDQKAEHGQQQPAPTHGVENVSKADLEPGVENDQEDRQLGDARQRSIGGDEIEQRGAEHNAGEDLANHLGLLVSREQTPQQPGRNNKDEKAGKKRHDVSLQTRRAMSLSRRLGAGDARYARCLPAVKNHVYIKELGHAAQRIRCNLSSRP